MHFPFAQLTGGVHVPQSSTCPQASVTSPHWIPRLAHDIAGPHVPVLATFVETVVPTVTVTMVSAEVPLPWALAPPPPAPLSTTTVEAHAALPARKRKAKPERRMSQG